jgi:hypothetical protein
MKILALIKLPSIRLLNALNAAPCSSEKQGVRNTRVDILLQ